MSFFYSKEILVEGNKNELLEVLREVSNIDNYDTEDFLRQIEENKQNLFNEEKLSSKIYIYFTAKNLSSMNVIFNLSKQYPDLLFSFRYETSDLFNDKQYKNGELINNVSFDNLICWRLYTKDMSLNSEDICKYIENDLDYLVDEAEDFASFKKSVLKEFEDVKFNGEYTKDDLMKDILNSYKYLTE